MISIQTNVNSLVAQQNLSVNSAFQSRTIAQLTSGYRINQSGDDAAGLAVANKYRSSIAELTQGVANGNDGVAQLQIMDGGMSNISQILDRLKTLATQSASGTINDQTRQTLNTEFQTDLKEIDRQAQSIGLDTGGTFAKSLSVYLGAGSGSSGTANSSAASLVNSQVTVDLSASAVDTQSLGLKGMQAANTATDIGVNSSTSVQNILSNTTGTQANNEATAGYALFQFSGAGFSDAGKIGVSVNLSGVTDVATLATAVNAAIQKSGGATAAGTAFQGANIVASVDTDPTSGSQSLAFSSSSSAFQVQAGDQMANALLGNVRVVGAVNGVGGVAMGTAVTGSTATTVTGASTTDGTFASSQVVKMVITGGGLVSPVTLQLGTSNSPDTSGAIADLKNQFAGNAQLQAAGLSMSGSTTPGTALTFDSASGQGFNIQVTGDTKNLLGLGSFLGDNLNDAEYSKITAGGQYLSTTMTGGNAITNGTTAQLEISLNGQAAAALAPIDLTAGTSAGLATATGIAINSPTAPAGSVDITKGSTDLNITVINDGVVTNKVFSLTTNTAATSGAVTTGTFTMASGSNYTFNTAITLGTTDNRITVSVDGKSAATLTLTAQTYTSSTALVTAIQAQITSNSTSTNGLAGLTAGWDAVAHRVTLTSSSTGATSSVAIGDSFATSGVAASGAFTMSTNTDNYTFNTAVTVSSGINDKFQVAVDGAPAVTLQLTAHTYTSGSDLATAIQSVITAATNANPSLVGLTASWDTNLHELSLTSTGSTGISSKVTLDDNFATSGVYKSSAFTVSTTDSNTFTAGTVTVSSGVNDQINVAVNGHPAVTLTLTAQTYTSGTALAAAVQSAITAATSGTNGLVGLTATWDSGTAKVVLTSTSLTGTGSTVALSDTLATNAKVTSGTFTNVSGDNNTFATAGTFAVTGGSNDKFNVAVDGHASVTLTLAAQTYTSGTQLVQQINTQITASTTATNGLIGLKATWDSTKQQVDFTSTASTGIGSFVTVSGVNANTGLASIGFSATAFNQGLAAGAGPSTGALTSLGLSGASTGGSTATSIGTLTNFGFSPTAGVVNGTAGQASISDGAHGASALNFTAATGTGLADLPQTLQSVANAIQAALGGATVATVKVNNDNSLSISSALKGANSSVTVNDAGNNSANGILGLTSASGVGKNSSIADIVSNLNAQFATGVFQKAGLVAAATGSDGTGVGTFINISSKNNTYFRLNSVGSATAGTAAAVLSTSLTSGSFTGSSITVSTSNNQFAITLGGNAAVTVSVAANTYTDASGFVNALNAAITASSLGASVTAGWDTTGALKLTSNNATSVSVSDVNGGIATFGLTGATTVTGVQATGTEDLGFGATGSTFTASTLSSAGSTISTTDAQGVSSTGALAFTAMQYGSDKQTLTFSATDTNGALQTKTITLENNALDGNRTGASIDDTVAAINQQLQADTSQPAMQQIVAVKENVGNQEQINFMSKLSSFTVGVSSTANGVGVANGVATTAKGSEVGTASNISIATQSGAQAAITAIGNAVSALGTAQAAVGKGENQLNYAISLAQSQITNFSAAESQIRDTNVAQQAANLTKAQTLQQASIAAMAQANSAPQAVLSLLRG